MKIIKVLFLVGVLILGMSLLGFGNMIFSDQDSYSDGEIITGFLNGAQYQLEVAVSSQAQRQGLMNRSSLAQDRGMIFIYSQEEMRSFWMKDTLVSLDMIFLDKNGYVVHIEEQVPPCLEKPCTSYSSKYPSQYVIEIKAGQSEKIGLSQGQHVAWKK